MPQNRGGERERDRDREREIEQGKRLKPYREKCYRNEIEGGGKSFPLRGERGGEMFSFFLRNNYGPGVVIHRNESLKGQFIDSLPKLILSNPKWAIANKETKYSVMLSSFTTNYNLTKSHWVGNSIFCSFVLRSFAQNRLY